MHLTTLHARHLHVLKAAAVQCHAVQCNAGHDDGSIRVWNLESGTCIDLQHHSNTVTCLAMAQVSAADELLFSAGAWPLHSAQKLKRGCALVVCCQVKLQLVFFVKSFSALLFQVKFLCCLLFQQASLLLAHQWCTSLLLDSVPGMCLPC